MKPNGRPRKQFHEVRRVFCRWTDTYTDLVLYGGQWRSLAAIERRLAKLRRLYRKQRKAQ